MEVFLEKYGSALTTEKSSFVIQTEDDKQVLSPEKITHIHLGAFCRVSTEAILLAIQHEVEILFLDRKGSPQARVWSNRFGSVSTIRRNQISFTRSEEGWNWIRTRLAERIEGQMGILLALQDNDVDRNNLVEKAVSRLNAFREKIQNNIENQTINWLQHSEDGKVTRQRFILKPYLCFCLSHINSRAEAEGRLRIPLMLC